MATAGKVTIAEVEELVEPGQLDSNRFTHREFSCGASCKAKTTRN
jgi:acyl CoA:acetate/3-ketoacid CoA transferase alpha subunit